MGWLVSYSSGRHFFDLFANVFQNRFSEIPSVLLTAKHAALKRKRDAATLWTEDITKTSFKICIRELQNFDGHHQNISVVGYFVVVRIISAQSSVVSH